MRRSALAIALTSGACAFDASGNSGGAATVASDDDTTGVSSPDASSADDADDDDGDVDSDGDETTTGASSNAVESSTTTDATDDGDATSSSTMSDDDDDDDDSSTGEEVTPWCDSRWPELAGCYDFANLGGGVLVDGSATANDGTVDGVSVEPGPLGEAAVFSGGSEVSVPAHPATDFGPEMTLELFVRLDGVPGSNRAGVLDRDGQWSIFLMADGQLRCGASAFAYWADATLDEWLHVGCVISEDEVLLFVNGEQVAQTDGAPISTGDPDPLAIGDNSPGFDEPLQGAIGGLRLWSELRTADELCEAAGDLCS